MRAWQRSAHAVVLALVLGGTVWSEARVYGADNVQLSTTAAHRASAVQKTRPRLVLWAWSRSDDLSFLAQLPSPDGRVPDVAFLSGEILIGPSGMQVRPRLRRLRLPQLSLQEPGSVERTAVVYVEIARHYRSQLGPQRIAAIAQRIRALPLVRDAQRLQLNFEAVASRRPDWYALVAALRAQMPATQRLDVTALADWCMHADFLPRGVDRVVPMLYSLGPVSPALSRVLDGAHPFPASICNASLGVTADTLMNVSHQLISRADRLYVFSSDAWQAQRYERLLHSLGEIDRAASETLPAF